MEKLASVSGVNHFTENNRKKVPHASTKACGDYLQATKKNNRVEASRLEKKYRTKQTSTHKKQLSRELLQFHTRFFTPFRAPRAVCGAHLRLLACAAAHLVPFAVNITLVARQCYHMCTHLLPRTKLDRQQDLV